MAFICFLQGDVSCLVAIVSAALRMIGGELGVLVGDLVKRLRPDSVLRWKRSVYTRWWDESVEPSSQGDGFRREVSFGGLGWIRRPYIRPIVTRDVKFDERENCLLNTQIEMRPRRRNVSRIEGIKAAVVTRSQWHR